MSTPTVMIMAGGTGGHIFPGLAVAESLKTLGAHPVWLGSRAGLEARLVPDHGMPVYWMNIRGVRGGTWVRRLRAPFMLIVAMFQAWRAFRSAKPDVVLSMGGFVAGPGGLVARLVGLPLVIHEQNARPGYTNRVLARFARQRLQGFEGSFPARMQATTVGNPVREVISALPSPEDRFAQRSGGIRLLVLGGSQGARTLNRFVPGALMRLPLTQRPQVWHQCGRVGEEETRTAYVEAGVVGRIEPFIDDMATAYAWADLVICRAGALTLAELSAAGLGSVLIPYPHAVDDHQTANAQALVDNGAARLIPESELSPKMLAGVIRDLCADRTGLLAMAVSARRLARPSAAADVARACLALTNAPAKEAA